MDIERLDARLRRQFRAAPERFGEATIVWRKGPLLLGEHVGAVLEGSGARRRKAQLRAWPGDVDGCLGERLVDVVSFRWLPYTPIEFSACVQVLDLGDRGYLCFRNDCHAHVVAARLEPWCDELVLSAAVKRLLHGNGRRFGLELFGSIPHETMNCQPDLLLAPVVKQAYFDWLLWAGEHPPTREAWLESNIVIPAEEWLRVARGEPILATGRSAVQAWRALADVRFQHLFDVWFEETYRVA